MKVAEECLEILSKESGYASIDQVAAIVREYYTMDGMGAGGSLHIVLDDGNTEERHVEWCLENSCVTQNDLAGHLLAQVLLLFTEDQRDRINKAKLVVGDRGRDRTSTGLSGASRPDSPSWIPRTQRSH